MAAGAAPSTLAQDFSFDPSITQAEFEEFSLTLGRAVYPSPVAPADRAGILALDIGIAISALEIDESAPFWQLAISEDILQDGYLLVPRLVVSKSFGRFNISGSYMTIPETDVDVIGATLDLTLSRDGLARPAIGIRGAWSELRGVDDLEMTITGLEAIISKKVGPITPYGAWGREMIESSGRILLPIPEDELILEADLEDDRLTVGARFSFFLFEIAAEAVRHDNDTTYGARASLSL